MAKKDGERPATIPSDKDGLIAIPREGGDPGESPSDTAEKPWLRASAGMTKQVLVSGDSASASTTAIPYRKAETNENSGE